MIFCWTDIGYSKTFQPGKDVTGLLHEGRRPNRIIVTYNDWLDYSEKDNVGKRRLEHWFFSHAQHRLSRDGDIVITKPLYSFKYKPKHNRECL